MKSWRTVWLFLPGVLCTTNVSDLGIPYFQIPTDFTSWIILILGPKTQINGIAEQLVLCIKYHSAYISNLEVPDTDLSNLSFPYDETWLILLDMWVHLNERLRLLGETHTLRMALSPNFPSSNCSLPRLGATKGHHSHHCVSTFIFLNKHSELSFFFKCWPMQGCFSYLSTWEINILY